MPTTTDPTSTRNTGAHTVLHDPSGRTAAGYPLDRDAHQALLHMVLAWPGDPALPENGLQLIAHRLTGAAHAVVDDLRYAAGRLPDTHPARALTDAVLHDTRRILHLPVEGTVHCARHRAHMVRALYGYLDRLDPTERP